MSKVIFNLLVLCWGVALLLAATVGSGSASAVSSARSSYPRSNRGFKNAQLSTARGFGKRFDANQLLQQQQQALQNIEGIFPSETRTYPNGWLIEELQTNPEVARLIVEKFIDVDGDGEISSDELFRRNYV